MKTGFEPGSTGLGGDCSVNCATTTTAHWWPSFTFFIKQPNLVFTTLSFRFAYLQCDQKKSPSVSETGPN